MNNSNSLDRLIGYFQEFLSQMAVGRTNWYGAYHPQFFEPRCLKAVPIVHFLLGASKPGEPLTPDSNHRTKEWWGEHGLPVVGRLKQQLKDEDATRYVDDRESMILLNQ